MTGNILATKGGLAMGERTISIDGIEVPRFLYGTAWKEEQTERLTVLALQQGFRGIDTANQRKHYDEAAVGRGIAAAIESGLVSRDDLFLQTKFTFLGGQDHRLPYERNAPVETQVAQSFASSLAHLGTDRIDSYVLHGPSRRVGLGDADWAAWRAMEAIYWAGRVKFLGISNVDVGKLQLLCNQARVAPKFVQNRCFAVQGWNRRVREFCEVNGIVYQGFSLLTANRDAISHPEIARIAERHGRTVSQIIFRLALDVGMIALTGTSNAEHMQADLDIFDFQLAEDEVRRIETLLA
jgi:diketogulonate reductase-like aldo/keto reductase